MAILPYVQTLTMTIPQIRERRWYQGGCERKPEKSRPQTGGYRHGFSRLLFLHRSQRHSHHRQLGRRRERIPGQRRSPSHPASDARARRQDARRSEDQGSLSAAAANLSGPPFWRLQLLDGPTHDTGRIISNNLLLNR